MSVPPYTKLLLVILIVAFGSIGILLYLPQVNTVNNDILTNSSVLFGIGVIGMCMVLISPIFFIESMYSHDYLEAFEYGMLLLIIGIVLIMAWLW
jgi:hypothetical protein